MTPRSMRRSILAGVAVVTAALLATAPAGANSPSARFWFSLSPTQPYEFTSYGPLGAQPGAPRMELIENTSGSIYLWARPQTDLSNQLLRLQNISLNLVLDGNTSPAIEIDDVLINNPPSDSVATNNRFAVVVDSAHQQMVDAGGETKVYPVVSSSGVTRFGGFTVTSPTATTGIGPVCTGDCLGGPTEPAWLLARIDLTGQAAGMVQGSLQVGSMAITHEGETTPFTKVRFGADPKLYEAATQREMTLDVTPEVELLVVDSLAGDYNHDNRVDAADYTAWRDTYGATGANLPADSDGDLQIGPGDYGVWRATYGSVSGCANAVPEPTPLVLAALIAVATAVGLRRVPRTALLAAAVAMGHATEARAVLLDANWNFVGDGNWSNSFNWDTPTAPNNGADTYDVMIGPLFAFPYAVTVDVPVTIDGLSVADPDATLDIQNSSFVVNSTLDPFIGVLKLSGAMASLESVSGDPVVIEQSLLSEAGSGLLNAASLTNNSLIHVTSGALSVFTGGSIQNNNEFQVDAGAELNLLPGVAYAHTGPAVLRGSGTFAVDSDASGSIDLFDTFTNGALVSPGNSPGILTIAGNYTQTTSGTLEIEITGLTAGSKHDRLDVGSGATLAGQLDLAISSFTPSASTEITILTAGATVSGGFDYVHVTGLPSTVAQRVVYNASDVRVQFVATSTPTFTATGTGASWSTAFGGSAPDSTSIVTLFTNVPGGADQTVTVSAPTVGTVPNAAHSLLLSDTTDNITLAISNTYLSVSTTTTIGLNGALELVGTSLLATESLAVQGGGRFAGGGDVVGDVAVGFTGAGVASFDPVNSLQVTGDYAQAATGRLAIEIPGDPLSGNDNLTVTGNVALGGILEIDATDLTNPEFTPGAAYDLVYYEGSLSGEFDRVNVVGRDDIYFEIDYGSGTSNSEAFARSLSAELSSLEVASATGYYRGDGDNDGDIDQYDAQVFAAMLLDNELDTFTYIENSQSKVAAASFIDAFDFVELTTGLRVVDFYDIPRFAQALADFQGQSLATAYATIDAAIVEAQLRASVPEPGAAWLLAATCLLGLPFGRSR
ncbi:hypothetical protein Pla108_28760 [Botrimarina colliarenosi]|uniref:Autotransporter-associated beta strand repeat protein n=1 Tax=Botrimarina colliarenosi TaxID=2528001 RepID=A0A5C6A8C6_9BACT|nr:hypothetical protein [Botrimarina colliarenosi]TWT95799.1 hypothetical protein Pla108_28760 [Botrimarina colliarenosi]